MPAGDAQRTWFPEMVNELRCRWHPEISLAVAVELRQELDTMLHRIRDERKIRIPVIQCPTGGHVGPAAEPHVSVRAMIIALGRFGLASVEEVKTWEKRWATHRKANGLDLNGKPAAMANTPAERCSH